MKTSTINSSIETPELPIAPLWRRLFSMIYDTFLIFAVSMAYGGITTAIYVSIFGTGQQDYSPMMNNPAYFAGWIAAILGVYCYFWRKDGQTVGMRAWRLRVIEQDGTDFSDTAPTPSFKTCVKRAIFAPISLAFFGIGYFWCLIDKNRDCLHDKFSGTRVVVTPKRKK